jgi:hypothetical protein
VSYALVYRRVTAGAVASERDASGVITVARRDLKLLARRPKAETDRRAVMLRPDLQRYKAWERAAGDSAPIQPLPLIGRPPLGAGWSLWRRTGRITNG